MRRERRHVVERRRMQREQRLVHHRLDHVVQRGVRLRAPEHSERAGKVEHVLAGRRRPSPPRIANQVEVGVRLPALAREPAAALFGGTAGSAPLSASGNTG